MAASTPIDAVRELLDRGGFRPATVATCEVKSQSERRVVCALGLAGDVPFRSRAVILKYPARPTAAAVSRMRHEAAAIRYLAALPDPELAALAPEIYYEDPQRGIVMMEDFTATRKAQWQYDLLLRPDGSPAVAGLTRLARTLGRLHRRTLGRAARHDAEHRAQAMQMERDLRLFGRKLRAFHLDLDADSAAELRAIDGLLHGGSMTSFCLRDVNPRNVFVSAAGVHVCDFEFADFAHPFAEGLHSGWPFPLSVECGALPDWLTRDLQDEYRRELGLADQAAAERADSAALIDFAFRYWVHTSPERGLPVAFAGARAKVLELAERLADVRHLHAFPSSARLLVRLGDALRRQGALGPDASCPYPCFQPAAGTRRVAEVEGHRAAVPGARLAGVFAVSPHCHLVIRTHGGARLTAFVLEAPVIQCDGVSTESGLFRATTMPLTLMIDADGSTLLVRDERTGHVVGARRCGWWQVACAHPIAVWRFWRHYYGSGRLARRLVNPSAVTRAHA
jgi:hypothetical protein